MNGDSPHYSKHFINPQHAPHTRPLHTLQTLSHQSGVEFRIADSAMQTALGRRSDVPSFVNMREGAVMKVSPAMSTASTTRYPRTDWNRVLCARAPAAAGAGTGAAPANEEAAAGGGGGSVAGGAAAGDDDAGVGPSGDGGSVAGWDNAGIGGVGGDDEMEAALAAVIPRTAAGGIPVASEEFALVCIYGSSMAVVWKRYGSGMYLLVQQYPHVICFLCSPTLIAWGIFLILHVPGHGGCAYRDRMRQAEHGGSHQRHARRGV